MAKSDVETLEEGEKKERMNYKERCSDLEKEVLALNYEIKMRDREIAHLNELLVIYRDGPRSTQTRQERIDEAFDTRDISSPLNQTIVVDEDDDHPF